MEQSKATFATTRVNRLIGRSLAAASILLSAESALNFAGQLPLLNRLFAWIVIGGLWLTTIMFAYTFWFGNARNIFLQIHALYMFVILFCWPYMLATTPPQDGHFYPWIWWAFDTGWIAAALAFRVRFAILYYLVLGLGMQFAFSLPSGGSHTTPQLVTDFLFTLLTNGAAAVIALLLRNAAKNTDQANDEAIRSSIQQAAAEAKSLESARLDALVHDSVLTALISANNANTQEQALAASNLAKEALAKLDQVQKSDYATKSVYARDLFDSICAASLRLDPKLDARSTVEANWAVDPLVASALTEATIQAVQNSVLHAGSKAQRELILKATARELKIVIKDDGVGFRPNRIPQGRLGMRLSIISRVEAVGGSVHIASAPRAGSTIILEWGQK